MIVYKVRIVIWMIQRSLFQGFFSQPGERLKSEMENARNTLKLQQ